MKTFSANALAEHFEIERKTMVRALRTQSPDAELTAGRPTWKISSAATALERHRRRMDGGGNGSGRTDPALDVLTDEHFAAEARMRGLPMLAERREAARAMIPQIVKMDKVTRKTGIANGHGSPARRSNAPALRAGH
jgi:hypothetical protein